VSVLPARFRLSGAFAVSGGVHALVLAALLLTHVGPAPLPTPVRILPVALVGRLGGGPGDGPGPEAPPAPPAAVAPPPAVAPAPKPRVAKTPRPARPKPAPPAESVASIAPQGSGTDASAATAPGGTGGPGDAGGGGGGGGGDGGGGARAAYGTNPLPPYPLAARRLGMEGVTFLDVLVAPDGKPVDVRVQKSSGFAPLDDSALKTVRERWRFVPAREGGTAVESRVTVPIRFRLADAGS
jgi:periplasmic protein TonB